MDPKPGLPYRSASQRARVVTEAWGAANLYCLACDRDRLVPARTGTRVLDFRCGCGLHYQLKAKAGPIGRTFTNSAYQPKVEAIRRGELPTYLLLSYDPAAWGVQALVAVPGHLLPLSAVRPRRPLGPSARRAGWVGSVIDLGALPPDGRIPVVHAAQELPKHTARTAFRRFLDLHDRPAAERGWLADVLRCVRALAPGEGDVFTLRELYAQAPMLAALHPENRNVHAKIRQQLQQLRDHGVLRFLGGGRYVVV